MEGFATVRAELHRGVLLKLYEAMGGADWTHKENWGTDAPLGSWEGVFVDGPGAVRMLLLRENGLTGAIPPELAGLETLNVLYLPGNSITGPIPEELGHLPRINVLVVSDRVFVPDLRSGHVGADHADAVQRRLFGDLLLVAVP